MLPYLTVQADKITVFVAASMGDVIKHAGNEFRASSAVKVRLNTASSGTLVRQLYSGAPADIFISASKQWADYAVDQKLILNNEMKAFAANTLVLIAPLDSPLKPFLLNKKINLPSQFSGRLSLGDPKHVPAGKYAMEALKYYGWDETVSKRLLPGSDVRSALMVVEFGEVEMGIVYKTDAMKSAKVKILAEFPAESHSQIVYYCGMSIEAGPKALQFLKWLTGPAGSALCEKHGFSQVKYSVK